MIVWSVCSGIGAPEVAWADFGWKIDPDEAEYLMGHGLRCWQEDEQWFTKIAADGPMYRAFGNSMAVPVLKWIGKRIKAVEDASK